MSFRKNGIKVKRTKPALFATAMLFTLPIQAAEVEAESTLRWQVGLGLQGGFDTMYYSKTEEPVDLQPTVNGFIGASWSFLDHLQWRNRFGAFDVPSYEIKIGNNTDGSHPPQYRGYYFQSGLVGHLGQWSLGAGAQYQFGQRIIDITNPYDLDPTLGGFVSIALNRWEHWSVEVETRWISLESEDDTRFSGDSMGIQVIYEF